MRAALEAVVLNVWRRKSPTGWVVGGLRKLVMLKVKEELLWLEKMLTTERTKLGRAST